MSAPKSRLGKAVRSKAQVSDEQSSDGGAVSQPAVAAAPSLALAPPLDDDQPEAQEMPSPAATSPVEMPATAPEAPTAAVVDSSRSAPVATTAPPAPEPEITPPPSTPAPISDPVPSPVPAPAAHRPAAAPMTKPPVRADGGAFEHLRQVMETGRDQREAVKAMPKRTGKGTYVRLPVHLQDVLGEYCDPVQAPMADFVAAVLDAYFRDAGFLPPAGQGHRPNEKALEKARRTSRSSSYDY